MTLGTFLLLLFVLLVVILLVQQLGVIPSFFGPGTTAAQKIVGLIVAVIIIAVILWALGLAVPSLRIHD